MGSHTARGWRCIGVNRTTGHCVQVPRWWNVWGMFWGRTR